MDLPDEPSECAFSKDPDSVCSAPEYINKMKEFLKMLGKPVPKSASSEHVVEKMKEATDCDSEVCLYEKSPFVKFVSPIVAAVAREEQFKVAGPATTNDWLSNLHIDGTLKQFAEAFPGFIHIPYQMRDFVKQRTELATFDFVSAAKSGMKTFACVLNTDVSRGGGEHWYALFGDFTKTPLRIEYFNSTGDYPQSEVYDWLTKLQFRLQEELKKPVEIMTVLSRGIQKDNDSCGLYSLYYIWSRLNGIEPRVFSDPSTAPNDQLMRDARKFFFIPDK